GRVAIGTTQDFADHGLPDLLRAFAASHPRVRIELRVGRSVELGQALQAGQLDLAITMRQAPSADQVALISEPMLWLCSRKGLAAQRGIWPSFSAAAWHCRPESRYALFPGSPQGKSRPFCGSASSQTGRGVWGDLGGDPSI